MIRPRVLQLGPLDSIHLRRWCELAADAGCTVTAAGHLRRGTSPVSLAGFATEARRAPSLPWSSRLAGLSGSRAQATLARRTRPLEPALLWVPWLRALCRRLRPDLVHAHLLDSWGVAATLAGCRPLLVSSWGSDAYLSRGALRRLARRAARDADLVTAPSPHLASRLEGWGGTARHLELGVDPGVNRPLDGPERDAARRSFGFGAGPVALSFRAPTALYRLDLIADAVGLLAESRPDVELAVAHGPLSLPDSAREALRSLGRRIRVHELGAVGPERMPALLAAADVGVSVPVSDGSPRSVWECLACGTPVVLSDLPQLRERLGEGRGAVFCSEGPGGVAAALDRVLADLPAARRRARELGRAWVAGHAGWEQHAARLGAAYESLLAAGPAPSSGSARATVRAAA